MRHRRLMLLLVACAVTAALLSVQRHTPRPVVGGTSDPASGVDHLHGMDLPQLQPPARPAPPPDADLPATHPPAVRGSLTDWNGIPRDYFSDDPPPVPEPLAY